MIYTLKYNCYFLKVKFGIISTMSQNKYMHPRNIYKNPPNFKEMAIMYPEFRKHTKADISGKITIDFKDPEALKALTCTLLQRDFDLKVDIPLTRLIPTVPLRLNYILWIEDLLDICGIHQSNYAAVHGIDIGTGASCIYPLLAAKKNKWHMLATEVDNESFKMAQQNVEVNKLHHLITLKLVSDHQLMLDLLEDEESYTFIMCNPPFFNSEMDLDYTVKSRSPSRPPPNNINTGSVKELIVPGGEVAFVLKMMKESKELGTRIKIYTTMLGHKSSIAILKQELKSMQVPSFVETRFCQGNTTRWGLSWTFEKNITLQKVYHTPSVKKSKIPMSWVVPNQNFVSENSYTVKAITKTVIDLLQGLEVQYSVKKQNNYLAIIEINAFKNSWSNQRKRKRLNKQQDDPRQSICVESNIKDIASKEIETKQSGLKRKFEEVPDKCSSVKLKHTPELIAFSSLESCVPNQSTNPAPTASSDSNSEVSSVPPIEPSEKSDCDTEESNLLTLHNSEKNLEGNKSDVQRETSQLGSMHCNLGIPLLEVTLVVRSLEADIYIELIWRGGTGGREAMHQILQYIKNRLNEKQI